MTKYGLQIETSQAAGRYCHKVYTARVRPDRVGDVSDKVVTAQKKVLEQLWDELPEGATGLECVIRYQIPKKKH